jgi:multidrug efflux pump subunit AcrA (membrane-fusion protein)
MTSALPAALSELDHLKLQLLTAKQARFQAETMNLQMAQRSLQALQQQLVQESAALSEHLRVTYALAPADEIGEDGVIARSPVRAIKEE